MTKNIYGRMDYRKKQGENVDFHKRNNRAFSKDSPSFLCASSNERNSKKLKKVECEQKYKLNINEYRELTGEKRETMDASSKEKLVAERGITLLALIITVVIMIILAAVTINVTLGDGGLVDQAKWAAEQTANSTQSEQEQLANVSSQINDIIAGIGTGGSDTNSTGGEDTNSVDTNSVDTNSVEETNTIDTNTIDPEPDPIPDGTITIGDPQWNGDGTANVSVTSSESEYIIQYQINGTDEGSWLTLQGGVVTGVKHRDTVYARITDGEQYSNPQNKKIEDTTAPQVSVTAQGSPSTNSITVTAQAVDNESGMVASPRYTFQYKTSGAGSYTTPSDASNVSSATYTFTGLTQGTTYDIQVIVNGDNAGNTGTGTTQATTDTVPGADEGLQTGTITASPVTWKDYKASTTLTVNETGFQIQYQVNGVVEGSWSEPADSPVTVSNLDHGNTVYARLTDGVNAGDYAAINILDGKAPTVSVEVGKVTDTTITVTVTAEDKESGLADNNAYKYYINNEETPRTTSSSNTYTYENLTAETPYNIKVEVVDKGNNTGTGTQTATTEAPPTPEIGDIKPSTPEEVDIFDNTTKVVDESGDEVWIPGGFGIDEESATDADDGIVITDGTNEFVWIPVPDYTTMYTEASATLNGVTTTTSVYSKLRVRSGDSYTVTPPGQTTGIREPDVLSSYDTSSSYYQTILGYGSTKLMADAFVDEYTATYNSIKKYKGFYIGRYELTGTVTNPTVQRDRKVLTNQNWYNLKKACSNIVSSSYAQSEMIYGNQWDEVMSWLVKTGEKTDSEVNSNSASWGNYSNSTGNAAEGSGTKRTSGYSEYWKANNIYDLAGNCRDWTQEAYSPYDRVSRGGTIGSFYPASDRSDNNPDYSNSYYSARSALYIKVGL